MPSQHAEPGRTSEREQMVAEQLIAPASARSRYWPRCDGFRASYSSQRRSGVPPTRTGPCPSIATKRSRSRTWSRG